LLAPPTGPLSGVRMPCTVAIGKCSVSEIQKNSGKRDHEVEAALQVVLPHFDLIFVMWSSSSPKACAACHQLHQKMSHGKKRRGRQRSR